MQSEVIFAGFGGQGILLIGKILAYTAMEEGREVALHTALKCAVEQLIVRLLSATGRLVRR
jgi:hypothetical protein